LIILFAPFASPASAHDRPVKAPERWLAPALF
jgi:hypothetical protein